MSIDPELVKAIESGKKIDVSLLKNGTVSLNVSGDDDYYYYDDGVQDGEYLIDANDAQSKVNENDWTLLHYAIYNNRPNIVNALLELGADIEARTKQDQTPLRLAVDRASDTSYTSSYLLDNANCVNIVQILIDSGADIESKQCSTLLDSVRSKGNREMIRLLEEAHNKTITTPSTKNVMKKIIHHNKSVMENTTNSNINGRIIDMRNSTLPIYTTPTMSSNSSPNATLSFDSTAIANNTAQTTNYNGNVLVVLICYTVACIGKKLFSHNNPSTIIDIPSVDHASHASKENYMT